MGRGDFNKVDTDLVTATTGGYNSFDDGVIRYVQVTSGWTEFIEDPAVRMYSGFCDIRDLNMQFFAI